MVQMETPAPIALKPTGHLHLSQTVPLSEERGPHPSVLGHMASCLPGTLQYPLFYPRCLSILYLEPLFLFPTTPTKLCTYSNLLQLKGEPLGSILNQPTPPPLSFS